MYYSKFYTDEDEKKLKNYELHNVYRWLIDNIFIEKQSNFIDVFYRFCNLTNYDYGDLMQTREKHKNQTFKNDLF